MKTRGWLIILSLFILLGGGIALALQEVWVLQVENTEHPAKLLIRTAPAARFSLSYINSIYLQPAAEDFQVGGGEEILLLGVRTRSPAVAAYYGFEEEEKEYYPVNRTLKSFVLRLGMSQAQVLSWADKQISLGELGEPGDRLEVRVVRMTRGRYLLSSGKKERG
jgi:hypothetical protein